MNRLQQAPKLFVFWPQSRLPLRKSYEIYPKLSFVSLLFQVCLKFFYLAIGSWFACFLRKYYCLCFFFGKGIVSSLT
jgi:hypothetical protein